MGNRTAQYLASALCPIALFIAMSIDASAQKPSVVSAMAKFDRALIPALFATEGPGSGERGTREVADLAGAWEVLEKTLVARRESDSRWAEDAVRIDDWIDRLRELEFTPSNVEEAHALLVQVRDALRMFRERDGLRYFPDRIVDFKERFDEIVSSLRDGNFEANHKGVADLSTKWSEIQQFRIDKIVYGLDYYRMGEFNAYRETVTASLDVLRDAIDRKDLASAMAKLETIQTNTTALYRLFGEFED